MATKSLEELAKGNSVVTSFGHELGNLTEMSWFPRDIFTLSNLAVINYFERLSNSVHLGKSRYLGGAYDEHPKDMLKLDRDISKQIEAEQGVVVLPNSQLQMVNAFNLHDYLEDNWEIELLRRVLRKVKERNNYQETKETVDIRAEIGKKRRELVQEQYKNQNSFIESLSVDSGEKRGMIFGGAISLGVEDWLTRHIEQIDYHNSIYSMHRRYKGEAYYSDGEGGPFQADLMKLLNVSEKDWEPMKYFWTRVYARSLDRISLSRERKPRFTDEQAKEIENLFQENEWLREMYGEGIIFKAEEMPKPYHLNLVYRDFIVLNSLDSALVDYGPQTVRDRENNHNTYVCLLGILKAREYLMKEVGKILFELRENYEEVLGDDIAPSMQTSVGRINTSNPREFEVITGEGPISRGLKYDTIYKDRWGDLEELSVDRIDNYRDTLIYDMLLGKFLDPQKNKIDLNKGTFKLFTIDGLTDNLVASISPLPISYMP